MRFVPNPRINPRILVCALALQRLYYCSRVNPNQTVSEVLATCSVLNRHVCSEIMLKNVFMQDQRPDACEMEETGFNAIRL